MVVINSFNWAPDQLTTWFHQKYTKNHKYKDLRNLIGGLNMCSIDCTYEQFGNTIYFRTELNFNSYKMMLIVVLK